VGKRIAIAVLLLPAAEAAVFLLVMWAIGFGPALGLMILTSVAGGLVLRRAGRGEIAAVGVAMRRRSLDGPAQSGGLGLAISGILLLLPGFITDLLGAALLVPLIRRRIVGTLARTINRPRPAAGPGAVIDLAPDEWHVVPDKPRRKPNRRI
jgi:UPF0716 protein FxsA